MGSIFSQAALEQVRAASDIVDVIGAAFPLKRAGANFVALCPFHKEKTPSFHVNPHKQIFHCFGCHKGGDVFKFIQDYENVSFPEAVKRLADRAKIPLELEQGHGNSNRFLKDALFKIHDLIAQRWQAALLNDPAAEPARHYLAKRKVPPEAVKLFRLGYAPEAWDDTVNWVRQKGFDLAIAEQAGLIIHKEGENRYYDRFRGRLIFPIADEQGRVIGFSGRILAGDEKIAKYVNSPETPIFTKGKVFFGLDKSKRALIEAGSALICEGQLDLIACFMAGIQNVVAPQGTAFTADHARILKRYVDEAVLCFDSDAAGQDAAVRVLDHLLAAGLTVRVATIPTPHDPDSFIRDCGADAFRLRVRQAAGFFDYYLDRLCATFDLQSDRGRVALVKAMAAAVHKTQNHVLIDTYAQKTALRLGVTPQAMRLEFQRTTQPKTAPAPSPQSPSPAPPPPKPHPQEFWLLKLALTQDDHIEWLNAHLDLNWIQHPLVRAILQLRFQLAVPSAAPPDASWLSQLTDPHAQDLATEALTESRPIPNPTQQLHDIVLRLRNQQIDRTLSTLLKQVTAPATPDQQKTELLREQTRLRRLKQTPLKNKGEQDAS